MLELLVYALAGKATFDLAAPYVGAAGSAAWSWLRKPNATQAKLDDQAAELAELRSVIEDMRADRAKLVLPAPSAPPAAIEPPRPEPAP